MRRATALCTLAAPPRRAQYVRHVRRTYLTSATAGAQLKTMTSAWWSHPSSSYLCGSALHIQRARLRMLLWRSRRWSRDCCDALATLPKTVTSTAADFLVVEVRPPFGRVDCGTSKRFRDRSRPLCDSKWDYRKSFTAVDGHAKTVGREEYSASALHHHTRAPVCTRTRTSTRTHTHARTYCGHRSKRVTRAWAKAPTAAEKAR